MPLFCCMRGSDIYNVIGTLSLVARQAGASRSAAKTAIGLCAGALLACPVAAAEYACPVAPPPLAPPKNAGKAVDMSANQVTLKNGKAIATGDVRLEQKSQALEAPRLIYNRQTTHVRAPKGLKYYRDGLYLTAESANVRLKNNTGEFSGAEYTMTQRGARGHAQRVKTVEQGRYILKGASYTTCVGPTKAWLLTADRIELNRESGRGEAYGTVMSFYGLPVFYSPYLNFPIDDRRHSGLLTPTIGHSSDSGYEVAMPWYFNLAPNYDATLIPHLLSERGLQISGQFRYLTKHHVGEIDASWLPEDQKYGASRSLVHYRHIGQLQPHLGIKAEFNSVSDDDYFDDLTTSLAQTSKTHLERNLRLTYERTGVRVSLLAEGFQNLNQRGPYERLPQLDLELVTPTAPFRAGVDAEFTAFESDHQIDAQRMDVRPHLNWSVDHGGWYANSELALRYTHYNFNEDDRNKASPRDSINRQIPVYSLGGGLRFMRALDNGWLQTLEPRVFYLYKGYEDQSDIPLFDTGVPDLHFERLFSTQRFVGADRIVDANQITLGVNSRLIEPDSGRTVLDLELGRIYAFEDPRVQWPGHVETGLGDGGSDYVAAAEYRPTRNIRAGFITQYDPEDQALDRAIVHASYRNGDGFRLKLAWRRYEGFRPVGGSGLETLEQTVVGLSVPLGSQMDFVGRWNYSLEKDRNVEILAGLEYRPSCCWATRLSWRRHVANNDGSYDTAVMFQFIFRGLASFGDTAGSIVDSSVFNN